MLGRPADSPAVRRARRGSNIEAPIATLLDPLRPDGSWRCDEPAWSPGAGPGWRMTVALELGADPGDPRLQAAAERLLGGSSLPGESCQRARALAGLLRLGLQHHPTVQEGLAALEEAEATADGGWPCLVSGHRSAGGGCFVTSVAVLTLFAAEPELRREPLRERAAGHLVSSELLAGGHRPVGWLQPGHPNISRSDLVEAAWALAASGAPYDPRLREILAEVQRLQDEHGRWSRRWTATFPGGIEGAAAGPSRWITLHAATALSRFAVEAALPRMFPEPPR